MSRVGRPLGEADAAVESLLEQWGREVGPDGAQLAKLGWPEETILSRIMREGSEGAGQSGGAPISISDTALVIDKAVRSLPKSKTRKVLRLWYCSKDRGNQLNCARRACASLRNFQLHLQMGRQQVADMLGVVSDD